MHPWMIEQVAREHRRDLLARAARPRGRSAWTWRKLTGYIAMKRHERQTRPGEAPATLALGRGAPAKPTRSAQVAAKPAAGTVVGPRSGRANAA